MDDGTEIRLAVEIDTEKVSCFEKFLFENIF